MCSTDLQGIMNISVLKVINPWRHFGRCRRSICSFVSPSMPFKHDPLRTSLTLLLDCYLLAPNADGWLKYFMYNHIKHLLWSQTICTQTDRKRNKKKPLKVRYGEDEWRRRVIKKRDFIWIYSARFHLSRLITPPKNKKKKETQKSSRIRRWHSNRKTSLSHQGKNICCNLLNQLCFILLCCQSKVKPKLIIPEKKPEDISHY